MNNITFCQLCNRGLKNRFGAHVRTHGVSPEDYYLKFISISGIPETCLCGCGRVTEFRGMHYRKYFSKICLLKTNLKNMWSDPNHVEFRSTLTKKRNSDPKSGIGFTNLWKTDKFKSARIESINQQTKMRKNNLEILFDKMTPDDIEYVSGSFWKTLSDNSRITPDFLIKGTNKIIEVFGNYWHSLIKGDINKQVTDEVNRIEKWSSVGMDCLVIWENEIYEDPKRVLYLIDLYRRGVKIERVSQVHKSVVFGSNIKVWDFTTICKDVVINDGCVIGSKCYIGRSSVLGTNVHLQDGVHITDRMIIGSNVFFGPHSISMNDRHPVVNNPNYIAEPPIIEDDVVIGAGVVLYPGVRIGNNSVIAAGAVVTRDIPPHSIVMIKDRLMVTSNLSMDTKTVLSHLADNNNKL